MSIEKEKQKVREKIWKILEEKKIEGELEGFEFESLKKDIKGITYHQAKLEKNKNYFVFEFIIDI